MNTPRQHIVKYHEANQRLDQFLTRRTLTNQDGFTSRSECVTAIKNGFVRINEAIVKPGSVLKTGDKVSFLPLIAKKSPQLIANPSLPITILFQNEHFITIDKPASIAMHPAGADENDTVANWVIAHFPKMAEVGENPLRPGIVHRLDKNTSGVCLLAKTQASFIELKALFKSRALQKTYLALVHGHIVPTSGTIKRPIARSLMITKQTTVDGSLKARGKIREAITHYTTLQKFEDFSLIELKPKTGRMHQLRVHLFSLGHPIVGDHLYGTKITRRIDQSLDPKPQRHLLHATQIEFDLFGEHFVCASPLPSDFQNRLDLFREKTLRIDENPI